MERGRRLPGRQVAAWGPGLLLLVLLLNRFSCLFMVPGGYLDTVFAYSDENDFHIAYSDMKMSMKTER